MSPRTERYPDTADGTRRYLAEDSALPDVEEAEARPDPSVEGVWKVATDEWTAIVYLAGYADPFGRERDANDFEVAWEEDR